MATMQEARRGGPFLTFNLKLKILAFNFKARGLNLKKLGPSNAKLWLFIQELEPSISKLDPLLIGIVHQHQHQPYLVVQQPLKVSKWKKL